MVKKKREKVSKFVYWTPRILSIVFIAFLSLFSLDVFGNGYNFWETLGGLFIHNIPSLILLIVVIISWNRYEILGGVVFILFGAFYLLRILITILMNSPIEWRMALGSLIILVPVFLIGILFLINWFKKRKKH